MGTGWGQGGGSSVQGKGVAGGAGSTVARTGGRGNGAHPILSTGDHRRGVWAQPDHVRIPAMAIAIPSPSHGSPCLWWRG